MLCVSRQSSRSIQMTTEVLNRGGRVGNTRPQFTHSSGICVHTNVKRERNKYDVIMTCRLSSYIVAIR